MTSYLKKKWIRALRSGDFEQTTGVLAYCGKYCCLGVLCEISGKLPFRNEHVFPDTKSVANNKIPKKGLVLVMLDPKDQQTLIRLNDDKQYTFNQIADWIKENI